MKVPKHLSFKLCNDKANKYPSQFCLYPSFFCHSDETKVDFGHEGTTLRNVKVNGEAASVFKHHDVCGEWQDSSRRHYRMEVTTCPPALTELRRENLQFPCLRR